MSNGLYTVSFFAVSAPATTTTTTR